MESQNLQICLVNILNFRFNYYFRVLLIYSHTTKNSYKSNNFSESEFKQYVGKVWDQNANKGMKKAKIPEMKSLPKSFDWRDHGAVTEVKTRLDVYDNYMVVSFSAFTMLSVIGC